MLALYVPLMDTPTEVLEILAEARRVLDARLRARGYPLPNADLNYALPNDPCADCRHDAEGALRVALDVNYDAERGGAHKAYYDHWVAERCAAKCG